jgi:hypothetical protein
MTIGHCEVVRERKAMNRRDIIAGIGASAGVAVSPAFAGVSVSAMDAAFNYAFTLFEFARLSQRAGGVVSETMSPAQRLNRLGTRRGLSNATNRNVTAPNNDTVYSSAFLELSGGPLELTVPDIEDRYFSIAFMNAFTDNFHYIGTRATKGKGGRFWIVGPDWRGRVPAGHQLIRSQTNDVWMLGRILVTGSEDVPAASAIQDGIKLVGVPGRGPNRPVLSPTDDNRNGEKILEAANEMLGRQRRLSGQAARARSFRSLGIQPGASNGFDALSPELKQAWLEAATRGIDRLRARFGRTARTVNGWASSDAQTGNFGNNDLQRASVALGGIAALSQEEAMYFSSVKDASGSDYDFTKTYRMRISPSGVPVDGFWSLTMYAAEPDGRFFFVPNPINRYALSDRSPGLVKEADGSIVIIMSREKPSDSLGGNWLPMANGPFRLSFRAYLPRLQVRQGAWYPPALELVS